MLHEKEIVMLDAIIVLGKEFRRFKGSPKLSMEAKMTAIAAGEIYKRAGHPLLIFTGGKTAGPEHASEAEAMAAYCRQRYDIPPAWLIIEDKAFDTIENARLAKKIVYDYEIDMSHILSRDYHLERAQGIFLREGLRVGPSSVEYMFAQRSPRHRKLAERYQSSFHYRVVRIKEFILRLQLSVDPEARIQRFITRRMRFAK